MVPVELHLRAEWRLIGLSDRIEALGGTLQVSRPAGSGTTLLIEIPLQSEKGAGSLQP
jgi:glucose-6-phosphate-specific signal transduction histidine kinase